MFGLKTISFRRVFSSLSKRTSYISDQIIEQYFSFKVSLYAVIVLRFNVPPQPKLEELKIDRIPHPPYSPDISLCDFFEEPQIAWIVHILSLLCRNLCVTLILAKLGWVWGLNFRLGLGWVGETVWIVTDLVYKQTRQGTGAVTWNFQLWV